MKTLEEKKLEWEYQLSNAYENKKIKNDNFNSVLKIVIAHYFGTKVSRIYDIIDDEDKFVKLLEEFSDVEIKLPTVNEFKQQITTTLVYFYREVLGYNWETIQKLLPYERDIGLRYNRRINSVNKEIAERLQELKDTQLKNNEDSIFN